jgi:glutathione S-transferase
MGQSSNSHAPGEARRKGRYSGDRVVPSSARIGTCLALIIYLWNMAGCSAARRRLGILAPATTGHPEFERAFRVQQNMIEQLVVFLPSLWIFSTTVSPLWGGILGLVFVIGRVIYSVTYVRAPETRRIGFRIAGVATLVLLFGGFAGVLRFMASLT